jgi:hypothetical protein
MEVEMMGELGDWGYFVVLLVVISVTVLGTYGLTKENWYKRGKRDGIEQEKKRHFDAKI